MTAPGAPAAAPPAADRTRWQSLGPIVLFDIAGPLVVYSLLRSSGVSLVGALALGGVLPAFGVAVTFRRNRRVDAVGVLVLIGIVVAAVVAIVSGDARDVLLEGSVPTGVFGLVCIGSLWSSRPLMFRFALEFTGADTPKGRDFAGRWRYEGFRHTFRVITVVWGIAYLAEAVARVIIVESTSTGVAFAISKVMPYVVAALVLAWMVPYGVRAKRKGEALGAAASAGAAPPPAV